MDLISTAGPKKSNNPDPLSTLKEFRCNCGKLLFKGLGISGIVELKCKRCNSLKRFELGAVA